MGVAEVSQYLIQQLISNWIFAIFLTLLIAQRLWELKRSSKNEEWLLSHGAKEYSPGHFRWMKLMHVSWFAAMFAEVLFIHAEIPLLVRLVAIVLFLVGQILRISAMATLGNRWNVKIIVMPKDHIISNGIYRYIKHPNYLGVIFEIFAAPLIFGALITSLLFSLLNGLILFVRIRAEESALREMNHYDDSFLGVKRFLPLQDRDVRKKHLRTSGEGR